MVNECNKRTNPGKCIKYYTTLVEKGKDVKKIFESQKLEREQIDDILKVQQPQKTSMQQIKKTKLRKAKPQSAKQIKDNASTVVQGYAES